MLFAVHYQAMEHMGSLESQTSRVLHNSIVHAKAWTIVKQDIVSSNILWLSNFVNHLYRPNWTPLSPIINNEGLWTCIQWFAIIWLEW